MAKSRSPILGYNHNVRFRGLVFHVQTEDSGISNPHVFTHLFHGGVILSTRKLVYDADASEDAVKGLMQSQHKAVLRDLKKGTFDDKIDAYLGGTPGLLPRGVTDDGGGVPLAASDEISQPLTMPIEVPPPLAPPEPAPPEPPPPDPARSRVPTPVPTPGSIAIPTPARTTSRQPVVTFKEDPPVEGRAPTERVMPTVTPKPAQSMTPPVVKTKDRGVSAAFDAIVVGGLAEVPGDEGAVEIRSEAPGAPPPLPGAAAAAPPPPTGERPGAYAQHRRRDSVPPFAANEPPTPPARPTPPPPSTPPPIASRVPTPRAATPPPRPPTPMARPSSSIPAQKPPTEPLPTFPSGKPPSPVPRGQTGRTRTPSGQGSGGVVVTRPAVIIGAPARTVGAATQPPPAGAPKGPPTGRVRKAREDTDSGLFGQDLISEKSLDEVILAYLSEDGSDE